MHTEIVAAAGDLSGAVELLGTGELVALPTETVYGLAADALNSIAVAKIFEVKERPRFDPLIVHLPSRELLAQVTVAKSQIEQNLMEKFWPGPLTLVFRKRSSVPDIVTAGLETVAVRMSAHPVFSQIVGKFGGPVAAPSANRFGRVSPTTAQHVWDELHGRIALIIDAGPTQHGIESTIVRVVDGLIEILRPGPITAHALRAFGTVREQTRPASIITPGQLPGHYAPRTRLIVVRSIADFCPAQGIRAGALLFQRDARFETEVAADIPVCGQAAASPRFVTTLFLSNSGNLAEAGANLFRAVRELDRQGLDLIVAELVPEQGIGAAINDRLQRAAGTKNLA